MAKGANGWAETATGVARNNRFHFLAAGQVGLAIVLSYDCEIDKDQSRVTIAPLNPIGSLSPEFQAKVMGQKIWALVPIPDVPGLGTFYADLRSLPQLRRALRIVWSGRPSLRQHLKVGGTTGGTASRRSK